MAMSEFLSKVGKQQYVRMRSTNLAQTAQNDWREVGLPQVAMHSLLPPF